jgi:hypothetical protein
VEVQCLEGQTAWLTFSGIENVLRDNPRRFFEELSFSDELYRDLQNQREGEVLEIEVTDCYDYDQEEKSWVSFNSASRVPSTVEPDAIDNSNSHKSYPEDAVRTIDGKTYANVEYAEGGKSAWITFNGIEDALRDDPEKYFAEISISPGLYDDFEDQREGQIFAVEMTEDEVTPPSEWIISAYIGAKESLDGTYFEGNPPWISSNDSERILIHMGQPILSMNTQKVSSLCG